MSRFPGIFKKAFRPLVNAIRKCSTEEPEIATTRLEKSLNQVILLGRVGMNPQLRGSEENPVSIFSVATHTNYRYQTGDLQQKTEWHRISVFKPNLRDVISKYLKKGQRVMIQGKLMYGQIKDASGTVHTTTTIVADDVIFLNKTQKEDEETNTYSES